MSKPAKTLERILRGTSDANIRFADLLALLRALGFREHIRGGHHIFSRDGIEDIINVQPNGSISKRYQIKRVRQLIHKYRLGDA